MVLTPFVIPSLVCMIVYYPNEPPLPPRKLFIFLDLNSFVFISKQNERTSRPNVFECLIYLVRKKQSI